MPSVHAKLEALLLLTATLTVTNAWPTSLHDQFNPLPDSSKLEPLPGNPREVNSNFPDVSLPGINENGTLLRIQTSLKEIYSSLPRK